MALLLRLKINFWEEEQTCTFRFFKPGDDVTIPLPLPPEALPKLNPPPPLPPTKAALFRPHLFLG